MRTVAIFGGGVGGLSCAHELVKHGFDVHVYEASPHLGGKARSQYVANTGTGGRGDLPGEHGFRFYPRFYRHLIRTMQEIPDPWSADGTVEGNLVGTEQVAVAMADHKLLVARRDRGDNLAKLRAFARAGATPRDVSRYVKANLQLATACRERAIAEYEPISWWEFIGGPKYGRRYGQVLASVTRTMVAMDARRGSARTVGNTSVRLLFDGIDERSPELDRTMTGPTSECWLEPWRRHLEAAGVQFHMQHAVESLECRGGKITSARIRDGRRGRVYSIGADEYVAAVPLDVFTRWLTPELCDADPTFPALRDHASRSMLTWMSGAQFYLREDVPLCAGHVFFSDAPWALTAISQAQFWNRGRRGMQHYGDGRLKGIISVDISDFFAPDEDGLTGAQCRSREQALERIWKQLLGSLGSDCARRLERSVYHRHLDDELQFGPDGLRNGAPLLVHPPGSFHARPRPDTHVANLSIAADFASTEMDLASMEGANEAARRASRGIVARAGIDPEQVALFSYDLPSPVERMQRVDRALFSAGLPHLFDGTRAWGSSAWNRRKRAEAQMARAGVPEEQGKEALRAIDAAAADDAAPLSVPTERDALDQLQ